MEELSMSYESAAHSWHQMQAHFVIGVQFSFSKRSRQYRTGTQKNKNYFSFLYKITSNFHSKWDEGKHATVMFLLALSCKNYIKLF